MCVCERERGVAGCCGLGWGVFVGIGQLLHALFPWRACASGLVENMSGPSPCGNGTSQFQDHARLPEA